MNVLGIDPGSRITGYGIVRYHAGQIDYVASGSIKLSGQFSERLVQLHESLTQVIDSHTIDQCAIESVFMSHNPNTALKLGQARGVCLLGLTLKIAPPYEYAPRQVKQTIVGIGSATKAQIQFIVAKRLNLSGHPAEDAADALAVALCHIQHLQQATVSL